jgi:hypothetical protein
MLNPFSWIIRFNDACSAPTASGLLALLGAFCLFCATDAHADTYQITFMNVTFTATCIGGGTCTEVINGSGLYDPVSDTAWDLSIQMTGTLNASLNIYGAPICTAPGCLSGTGATGNNVLYDPNTLLGFNPIEFEPNLGNQFDVPTPQPLIGGPNGTLLFVPGMCGGDQSACNSTGAFPGNSTTAYELTSGTYTSVDVGSSPVPEPATVLQIISGLLPIAGLTLRKRSRR